jgi:uncharacterized protein YgbK (DUF1537 family)
MKQRGNRASRDTVPFAVLADDLTGALTSATRLRERGFGVRVVWDAAQLDTGGGLDAVVVDLRSRDLPSGHHEYARRWTRLLADAGFGRFECRMDSTLCGHTREEVQGILDEIEDRTPIVMAVPAFPEAGRVTRRGIQHIDNASSGTHSEVDVGPALFGSAPRTRVDETTIDAGPRAVADAVLATRGLTGPSFVLVDSWLDEHLAIAGAAAQLLVEAGLTLVTVSPGAWLSHFPAYESREVALVVVASPTAENRAQQTELIRRPGAVLLQPRDVLADAPGWTDALKQNATVVLSTIGETPAADRPLGLASEAAQATFAVLTEIGHRGLRCRTLVVTGGHVAGQVADCLGALTLVPVDQVGPMCSRARVCGGAWDGLLMVTKGGQMGDLDTLATLANLRETDTCFQR